MSDVLLLNEELSLTRLNQRALEPIASYQGLRCVDLSELTHIDSAGLAYLVQIKTHYPTLLLANAPAKLRVLAALYDVQELFEE